MLLTTLIAQKTDLGGFGAPSEAFEPELDPTGLTAISTFERLISVALGGVTVVAGLYLLFTFVVSAYSWLSAGGDAGKVAKARDAMVNALIGMVLIVSAYAIMGVVGSVFGISILRPGDMLLKLAPNAGETP